MSILSGLIRNGARTSSLALANVAPVFCRRVDSYSRRGSNILRGKYWFRNPDGTYKEHNESITVLPEEFADQGLFESIFDALIGCFNNKKKLYIFKMSTKRKEGSMMNTSSATSHICGKKKSFWQYNCQKRSQRRKYTIVNIQEMIL